MKQFHQKKGPFLKSKNQTSHMMHILLLSLLPIILFSEFKNGILPFIDQKTDFLGMIYPIFMIIFSGTMTYIIEYICARGILKKKEESLKQYMKNSYAILPGIFLGLILPLNTPLSIVFMGDIAAILIGKMVYGGFGHNIFNPALIGRLFIITAYALVITENGGYLNPSETDVISSATPLSNQIEGIGTYETLVEPYGNLLDFFVGTIPGAVGETSALLCILAFLFLTYHKVIKWRIPCIYIATVFIGTWIIGAYNGVGIWYPLFQILSGGLFFGAVFMATDPVTSPTTKTGQILFGLSLGILTIIFRYLTPYPEGVLTSILTMNMFVFICDKIGSKSNHHKAYRYSTIVLLIIGLLITTFIAKTNYQPTEKDPDYQILEKKINGNKAHYIVTQKGYGGLIKAEIIVQNGVVTKYTIIEHNETFYQKIEEQNYLENLLTNQNTSVETISGATITSTALKKMMLNTIEDYNKSDIQKTNEKPEIEKPTTNETIKITDVERLGTEDIYHITTKGFSGNLKLLITVQENTITNIEIIEQHDSYFSKIENENYIQKLIENQNTIETVDTVSGATITGDALKKAVIKVIEESRKANEK